MRSLSGEEGRFLKYCTHCGAEVHEEAVICVKCGCSIEQKKVVAEVSTKTDDVMQTVVKVFLIIGCVAQGWMLIPLAWCLPMTISIFNSFRDKKPISTAMKVCTLIFVSLIAGICLLCMNENEQ